MLQSACNSDTVMDLLSGGVRLSDNYTIHTTDNTRYNLVHDTDPTKGISAWVIAYAVSQKSIFVLQATQRDSQVDTRLSNLETTCRYYRVNLGDDKKILYNTNTEWLKSISEEIVDFNIESHIKRTTKKSELNFCYDITFDDPM